MLFNASRKERFLEEVISPGTQEAYYGVFASTSKMEIDLAKDLCEFSIQEIIDVIQKIVHSGASRRMRVTRFIARYVKWCEDNGYAEIGRGEAIYNIPLVELYEVNGFLLEHHNFHDVHMELLSVYKETDGYLIYPSSCLAYLGIHQDEAFLLRNEDIDIPNKTIHLSNKDVKIDDDNILRILSIYKNTTVGTRTQNQTFSVFLCDTGKFLKAARTKNSTKDGILKKRNIIESFVQFRRQYEHVFKRPTMISYDNVWVLGAMNRLMELDKSCNWKINELPKGIVIKTYGAKGHFASHETILAEYTKFKEIVLCQND